MNSWITTIFGLLAAIGGAVIGALTTGTIDPATLPHWVKTVALLLFIIGSAGVGFAARDNGKSSEDVGAKPDSIAASVLRSGNGQGGFANLKFLFLMFFCSMVTLYFVGCVALQPGADPIVVRVEQTETVAKSTFDLVLNVDNSNRPFFATNAPPFHQFCEWLRAPQTVEQTNTLPRAAAMLVSLDDVKLAYKSSRASSNDLFSALTTIQATMNQANAWMTVITNQPTK